MSFDIYGNPLRRGYCEVHPQVHEEYPCSLCVVEGQQRTAQPELDYQDMHIGALESRIEALEAENGRLQSALRDIIKHQNVVGGSLSAYSRTVEIARTALQEPSREAEVVGE